MWKKSKNVKRFVKRFVECLNHEIAHYFIVKEMWKTKKPISYDMQERLAEWFSEEVEKELVYETVRCGNEMIAIICER